MRKPPRKNLYSYLIPFVALAIILGVISYFITSSGAISFGAGAPAYLEVQNPDVKVLLKNSDTWRSVPEKVSIKLFRGDAIKTNPEGEARIQLLKDSMVYADSDTSLEITELNESDSFQKTGLNFISGKVLVKAERIINPKSNFRVSYGKTQFDTRGATFIVSDELIQILEGKVTVEKYEKDKVYASLEIGIGQQLDLSETSDGAFHELAPIQGEVYASPWVERALGKTLTSPEEMVKTPKEENPLIVSNEEESNSSEKTPEKTITGKHFLSIDNLTGNTESITIQDKEYEIKGTVSTGATKIVVNGYTLSKFKEGDTTWSYRARTDLGNLKEGKNVFEIVAHFPDEAQITKSITINYQSGNSPSQASSETTDVKLAVISPKEGESVNTDPVVIRGTAPEGTEKIIIDDYALRSYKAGDAQWKYTASQQFGNLKTGKNSYLITAYDKNNKEISSVSFSFTSTVTTQTTTPTTTNTSGQ